MSTNYFDIDGDICQNPINAFSKEWLLTNGLGGFASTTIIGTNTTKYHGLLIAPLSPPLNRYLFLSKLEEQVILENKQISLSTNIYPNTIFPTGYSYIVNFKLDPFPTLTYLIDEEIEIEKSIFLVYGKNQVVVKYRINSAKQPITLRISPLTAFREIHTTIYENKDINNDFSVENNSITFLPYKDLPPLYFSFNTNNIQKSGLWYKNFIYPKELEKELKGTEDLFNPFTVDYHLNEGDDAFFLASLEKTEIINPDDIEKLEKDRIKKLKESNPIKNADPNIVGILKTAADSFVVKKGSGKTIIAGYPWHPERTTDAMLSLSGLCLVTKRYEDARSILLKILEYYKNDLLPEYFSEENNSPKFTSIYPCLLFINAVYNYYISTKDLETLQNPLFYAIQAIINTFSRNSNLNIKENVDGLLCWDDPKTLSSWGTKGGYGKAGLNVEINALWYNALMIMAFLSGEIGDTNTYEIFSVKAKKTKDSFNNIFPIPDKKYLYDTVYLDEKIDRLTPYQIFTISLPFPVLNESLWKDVFNTITTKLLTPFGLRTLSPDDPDFKSKYEGNLLERASAYHNGAVWTWLIGPYIDAFLKIHKRDFSTRQKGLSILKNIFDKFLKENLGLIPEVTDALEPYNMSGCMSQALSTAEILRSYINLVTI